MAVRTSITINGLDEFRKQLEELGGNFKEAIRTGSKKAAKKLEKEVNAEAKARGWTENKYYTTKEKKSSKISDTFAAIQVGTIEKKKGTVPSKNKSKWYKENGDRFCVRFPEYGTINQKPNPLLIPSFEKNKGAIELSIKNEVRKAIEESKKFGK